MGNPNLRNDILLLIIIIIIIIVIVILTTETCVHGVMPDVSSMNGVIVEQPLGILVIRIAQYCVYLTNNISIVDD